MTLRLPATFRLRSARRPSAALAAAALAAGTLASLAPIPALAQAQAPAPDSAAEARLRKIEAEVRALQRKVFPGGDGRFFEPQIAPGTTPATTTTAPAQTGAPSTTAVTDILVRLDALEAQLRGLTARSEEQANALSQMETRLAALETAANAPVTPAPAPLPAAAAVTAPAPTPAPAPAPAATTPATRPAVQAKPAPTPAPKPAATAPAATTVAAPSPARLAAVQAIAKPQTADAGDDEYSYGFRLWSAGFYPEARQQLIRFIEQYPNHPRISFGRNLLGRAFLDDKLYDEATRWFLRNYQADKAGDRAPDSLLYLGKTQIAKGDMPKACIALAEFGETYPLIATGRLADEYKASLARVKCS